jgi:hypothetical protein
VAWALAALLGLLAWGNGGAGPAAAYTVSLTNPTEHTVEAEVFVIGPDLGCQGLGVRMLPAGGAATWETGELCPGGLAGRTRTARGWQALAETSCLGGQRPRSDWTSCCRDLSFAICLRPDGRRGFCPQ